MHLFHQPELQSDLLELSEEETRHAVRVLRLSVGDKIDVTDGKGIRVKAEIIEISKKNCTFRILTKVKEERLILPKIAIAPTKSIARFEWFLEKAVEIGVSEIQPILCSNSERKILKHERCEKVLLAAMKQSQRNWLPKLHPLLSYENFIKSSEENIFIAHCREAEKKYLSKKMKANGWILIGPEGDFTLKEIELALSEGSTEIDLGKSRLRTETAGIMALSVINY